MLEILPQKYFVILGAYNVFACTASYCVKNCREDTGRVSEYERSEL